MRHNCVYALPEEEFGHNRWRDVKTERKFYSEENFPQLVDVFNVKKTRLDIK